MKKISAMLLACAMLFILAGCDDLPSNGTNAGDSSSEDSSGASVITAEDGGAQGYLGDTMRTAFFDFSVNSAYTCSELENYTPSSGNKLMVAELTVKNTSTYSMPMFDSDFQSQWGDDSDDAYAYPISESIIDGQMPAEYEIPINDSVTYTAVFEVPTDAKDFSISFLEYYENGEVGDVFFVYFTAPEQ